MCVGVFKGGGGGGLKATDVKLGAKLLNCSRSRMGLLPSELQSPPPHTPRPHDASSSLITGLINRQLNWTFNWMWLQL